MSFLLQKPSINYYKLSFYQHYEIFSDKKISRHTQNMGFFTNNKMKNEIEISNKKMKLWN